MHKRIFLLSYLTFQWFGKELDLFLSYLYVASHAILFHVKYVTLSIVFVWEHFWVLLHIYEWYNDWNIRKLIEKDLWFAISNVGLRLAPPTQRLPHSVGLHAYMINDILIIEILAHFVHWNLFLLILKPHVISLWVGRFLF